MDIRMDRFDYMILEELQNNSKIAIAELGRMIGLSTTATKERVKKLEQEGIIAGYYTLLNAKKVNKGITAFITVPVGDISVREMGDMLAAMPDVVECHKVTGNTCFLIKVRSRNPEELEILIDRINQFAKNTYTYMVLSTSKETTHINLDEIRVTP
jgi:Lrp/AsnC family transcriptional regulator, leucine-responsive regulatory protein